MNTDISKDVKKLKITNWRKQRKPSRCFRRRNFWQQWRPKFTELLELLEANFASIRGTWSTADDCRVNHQGYKAGWICSGRKRWVGWLLSLYQRCADTLGSSEYAVFSFCNERRQVIAFRCIYECNISTVSQWSTFYGTDHGVGLGSNRCDRREYCVFQHPWLMPVDVHYWGYSQTLALTHSKWKETRLFRRKTKARKVDGAEVVDETV